MKGHILWVVPSVIIWGLLASFACSGKASTFQSDTLTEICFNAPFEGYRGCREWALDNLRLGKSAKELKAEVDDAEDEDKEAMDCASYPNQHGCGRSV